MRDARRPLRLVAAALLVIAAGLVALIAAGVFDPRPFGPLVRSESLGPRALPGRGEAFFALADPFGSAWPDRFSVRLTAAHTGGELDSGYGLALGDEEEALVVSVSPLGYVAIWQTGAGGAPVFFLPWQTWPHARPGTAANELWLDVERGDGPARVTAWLNRELLWRGEVEALPDGAALWLGSFGGAVEVDFRALEWFAEATPGATTPASSTPSRPPP